VVDELRAHRAEGRRVVLVSGMIEPLLRIVAQEVGDVDAIGTPLEFVDDVFSGELADPFNVGPRKVAQLRYFATDGKIHSAYGDTVRDIPMLEMAFDPVVVAPDAGLREAAAANNWRIIPE
jgi:phosphoserine phosphatase